MCLDNEETFCMIQDIVNLLSGGVVKVEIADQAWCSLIKLSVEEYFMRVNNWLIANQWSEIVNKDLNVTDVCYAMTTRTIDYEKQFAYAYSKQVGLGGSGHFELKKDFIDIFEGQQTYVIPAGREINEVLWATPSDIDLARISAMGNGVGVGINTWGGMGGWAGGGYNWQVGMYYIAPAYDTVLRAMDMSLKHRMVQSDLTYKVTDGADGTKLLHLYSVPNHGNTIGTRHGHYQCKVWYYYYDTTDMDATKKNKCLASCKDIVKFPSDVPTADLNFCDLNQPARVWVRKYITALAKEALGRSRGKWSGKFAIPEAEVTLDYASLHAEAIDEKKDLVAEIKEQLEYLTPVKVLERKASEAESLNKILGYTPSGLFLI